MSNSQWHNDQAVGEAALRRLEEMAKRDRALGAAVRAAVEHVEGDHVAGFVYTKSKYGEVTIGLDQLEVLRAIDRVLRDEERKDGRR